MRVYYILSLSKKEDFGSLPKLPHEERYAPTQVESLAIQSLTSFPTKTRNKVHLNKSYSELTNQLTIQLCVDISMFVCVSRKFEHGLLFCYESRIMGGVRGRGLYRGQF